MSSLRTKPKKPSTQNLTPARVKGLLGKLDEQPQGRAAEPLTAEDIADMRDIIKTWAYLIQRLREGRLTIKEMQELAGIEAKLKNRGSGSGGGGSGSGSGNGGGSGSGNGGGNRGGSGGSGPGGGASSDSNGNGNSNRDPHGRRGADDFQDRDERLHTHSSLKPGDPCPVEGCDGTLYNIDAKRFMSISAESPFKATEHVVDQLQCNTCKAVFPAPLPQKLAADLQNGNGSHLYSISAVVMTVVMRYFAGLPWYRQEGLAQMIGGPIIPDSSMADHSERLANALSGVFKLMRTLAASAWMFLADDTTNRITDQQSVMKEQRKTGKQTERIGCHTTAIIAYMRDGPPITIFDTGIHYAGEVLDDILRNRATTLPPPFIVGDGSSQNTVTVVKTIPCGCNSHAVRKFKDCRDAFPEETAKVLAVYGEIFKLEAKLQSEGASPANRLAMHRLTSMPLLNLLCRDGQALFDNKVVEPNSELGAAYNYLLNQQRPLMAFTRYEGIPLTNNEDERTIKMIVLVRKNSQNFTTSVGADIADVIWTCGATALRSGDSLSAYFSHVLRHRRLARQMPELFLPWSWREHKSTVESTVSKTTSAPRAAPSPRSVPKDLVLQ